MLFSHKSITTSGGIKKKMWIVRELVKGMLELMQRRAVSQKRIWTVESRGEELPHCPWCLVMIHLWIGFELFDKQECHQPRLWITLRSVLIVVESRPPRMSKHHKMQIVKTENKLSWSWREDIHSSGIEKDEDMEEKSPSSFVFNVEGLHWFQIQAVLYYWSTPHKSVERTSVYKFSGCKPFSTSHSLQATPYNLLLQAYLCGINLQLRVIIYAWSDKLETHYDEEHQMRLTIECTQKEYVMPNRSFLRESLSSNDLHILRHWPVLDSVCMSLA